MFFSKESTIVKTDMMANIPTVTPSKESVVRSKFIFSAFHANRKLSSINLATFTTGIN
jgi:hypothetical protein